MKKSLLIYLLIFSTLPSFSQNNGTHIKCTYNLKFQMDSTDTNSVRSEHMLLYISGNKSLFISLNQLKRDSFMVAMEKTYVPGSPIDLSSMNVPKSSFRFKIIKSNDKINFYGKLPSGHYLYKESRNNIEWSLKSERKKINGYNCQKAEGIYGGRNYTTWFSTEIPMANGPYKFGELPGLIVKIYDQQRHYEFELISIDRQAKNKIEIPDGFSLVSKSEYFGMVRGYKANPLQAIAQLGNFNLNPEDKRRIVERAKKANNPIELTIE